MARIRTIKPSFWSDQKVCQLGRDARLLCVGLISFADDEGRFLASPGAIIGYVFPNDAVTPKQVLTWRKEIADLGLIKLYRSSGFDYGHFPRWSSHQRISHPTPSTFPPPPVAKVSGANPDDGQNRSGGNGE